MGKGKKNDGKIYFGILANLNINNKHYLQDYDRLQHSWKKVDVYNYIKEIDRTGSCCLEDMIDDSVRNFKDDAKWINSFDGVGEESRFFVTCYLKDDDGNPTCIEVFKRLFY